MEKDRYVKISVIVLPLVVAAATILFYWLTYVPAIWYKDAFTYVTHAIAWHRGDGVYVFPLHKLDYIGWIWLVSLLPATRLATPCNAMSLLLAAKAISIAFTVAASVGVGLVAKRLFASTKFALVAVALFAANPVIWQNGQGALTDLPAVSFMVFSFWFLVRFWRGRRWADLVVGALVASLGGVVRAESLLVLVTYVVVILAVALEGQQSAGARLKTILKYGLVSAACALVLPLLVYGLPWQLRSAVMPLGMPSLKDLLIGWKWYVLRDIGWFWCLLAWTGLALGIRKRDSRPLALAMAALIVIGSSYFASSNQIGADIPRFLAPTIPFTLLGIGYFWTGVRWRSAKAAVVVLAAAYVISVFVGLRSPPRLGYQEPPKWAKVFLLQKYLASDASGGYVQVLPDMVHYNAVRTVVPDGTAFVLQGHGDLDEVYEVNQGVQPPMRMIRIDSGLPPPQRFQGLAELPSGKPVYVYPGPDDAAIESLLSDQGFVFRGDVCGARWFQRD